MTASPPVVRIGSPGDIAAAVPHLLGFVPTESVVLIALHGPRRRLGLTVRFDLVPAEHNRAVAGMLARRARHEQPREVVVLIFTSEPDTEGLVRRDLVDAITAKMRVPITDAVLVRHDRWWSYLCDDLRCCPAEGTPVDAQSAGATALAAAHALAGRAVLADRAAVVESLAPVTGAAARAADRAVDRLMDEVCAESSDARRTRSLELVEELATRCLDARATISDAEAAYLQLACLDVLVRDAVLHHVMSAAPVGSEPAGRIEAATRVFRDVARRAPPDVAAPAWTMFAWLAYGEGSGVVANVALDHALAADPDYSLAQLLREALDRQVPPTLLRTT